MSGRKGVEENSIQRKKSRRVLTSTLRKNAPTDDNTPEKKASSQSSIKRRKSLFSMNHSGSLNRDNKKSLVVTEQPMDLSLDTELKWLREDDYMSCLKKVNFTPSTTIKRGSQCLEFLHNLMRIRRFEVLRLSLFSDLSLVNDYMSQCGSLVSSFCTATFSQQMFYVHLKDHYPHTYVPTTFKNVIKLPQEMLNGRGDRVMEGGDHYIPNSSICDDSIEPNEVNIISRGSFLDSAASVSPANTTFSSLYGALKERKRLVRHLRTPHGLNNDFISIKPYPQPSEAVSLRYTIQVHSLKSEVYEEPLWCVMSFYDIKLKKKIAEDFTFKFINSEAERTMDDLNSLDGSAAAKALSDCKMATLSIMHSSISDIYIVLKVQSLHYGLSSDKHRSIYNANNKKIQKRHMTEVMVRSLQRPLLLSPMGWYAYSLKSCVTNDVNSASTSTMGTTMSSNQKTSTQDKLNYVKVTIKEGASKDTSATTAIVSGEIFCDKGSKYSEKTIIDILSDYSRNQTLPINPNRYNINFSFSVVPCLETNVNCISSGSFQKNNFNENLPCCVELEDFHPITLLTPHKSFKNYCYLEIEQVLPLSRYCPSKTLVCQIQLIDASTKSPLSVFLTKMGYHNLSKDFYLTVNSCTKNMYYHDPVRVALPMNISPKSFFLITFYGCTFGKNYDQELTLMLQTWVNLFDENFCYNEGKHNLPLCNKDLPNGHEQFSPVSKISQTTVDWIDDQKPYVTIRLRSLSSIYPHNFAALNLLSLNYNPDHRAMLRDFSEVTTDFRNSLDSDSSKSSLSYLYPILNKLLSNFFLVPSEEGSSQTATVTPNDGSVVDASSHTMNNMTVVNQKLLGNAFTVMIEFLKHHADYFEFFSDGIGRNMSLGLYSSYFFNPLWLSSLRTSAIIDKNAPSLIADSKKCSMSSQSVRLGCEYFFVCWASLSDECFVLSMSSVWFLFELATKMVHSSVLCYEHQQMASPLTKVSTSRLSNSAYGASNEPEFSMSDNFYAAIIKVSRRCGEQVVMSIIHDAGTHVSIGSAFIHFVLQMGSRLPQGSLRLILSSFFSEMSSAAVRTGIATDSNRQQVLLELHIDLLLLVVSDPIFSLTDVVYLASVPSATLPVNESAIHEFIKSKLLVTHIVVTTIISILRDEPDLTLKAFHLLLIFVTSVFSFTASSEDKSKNFQELFQSQDTAASLLAYAFYPLLSHIMRFLKVTKVADQLEDDTDRSAYNIDFLRQNLFMSACGFHFAIPSIENKISKFGYNYMSNVSIMLLWLLRNLDPNILLGIIDSWNSVMCYEYTLAIFSCAYYLQVSKEENNTEATQLNSDVFSSHASTSTFGHKTTNIHDGALTKSNALTMLRRRRNKKIQNFFWNEKPTNIHQNSIFSVLSVTESHWNKNEIISESTVYITEITQRIIDAYVNKKISSFDSAKRFLQLIINLLFTKQPVAIKRDIVLVLSTALTKLPWWVFGGDQYVCRGLCTGLFELFRSKHEPLRVVAVNLYQKIYENYYQQQNSFVMVSGITLITLSSFPIKTKRDFVTIFNTMESLKNNLHKSLSSQKPLHKKELDVSTSTMLKIMKNRIKLHYFEQKSCNLLSVNVILQIVDDCQTSVDLRLYWLTNLCDSLSKEFSICVGMCRLHIVALCFEYRRENGIGDRLKHIGMSYFEGISSNVRDEVLLDSGSRNKYHDTAVKFTDMQLTALLKSAAEIFENSHAYLLAFKTMSLVCDLYFQQRAYKHIAQVTKNMENCISNAANGSGGTFTYFRTRFIGKVFSNHGIDNEYIYHFASIVTLGEFCDFLTENYTVLCDDIPLIIVRSPHDITQSELKQDEAYIQVTNVEPFFEEGDKQHDENTFESLYNISKFFYTTPYVKDSNNEFIKSNSSQLTIKNQYSRLTVLHTSQTLPCLSPYVPVLSRTQRYQTPIELSITDLFKRIKQLQRICEMRSPNLVLLEGLLQGCVSTSVNQGPLAIAEAFLSRLEPEQSENIQSSSPSTKEDSMLRRLTNTFKKMVSAVDIGLKVFQSNIDPSRLEFYQLLQSKFKELCEKLSEYIVLE